MKKNSEKIGRPPAGGRGEAAAEPARAGGGQQAGDGEFGIIVENARDRRGLEWLRERVGDEAIRQAAGEIAGKRKPYLSNVAKILRVRIPDDLGHDEWRADQRQRLQELRRELFF